MLWKGRRESGNVEDMRGRSAGPGTMRLAGGGGAVTIVIIVIALLMGKNPLALLDQLNTGGGGFGESAQVQQADQPIDPKQQPLKDFVSVVLADTEDVWGALFQQQFNRAYPQAKLVLFSGAVESACGSASSASGPFYCPGDQKLYIDLTFYEELKSRFRAPGDFAMAYVVAHEVGHHVQHVLGITDRVGRDDNEASVRLELQADYLAGVWAYHAQKMKNIIEQGDVEEALNAANAIGDDTLQRQSSGRVVPDSFTHGTSAQRVRWFKKGFTTGDIRGMDQLFKLPYGQL